MYADRMRLLHASGVDLSLAWFLGFLALLLCWGVGSVLIRWGRRRLASGWVAWARAYCERPPEWREVQLGECSGLDHEFYERATRVLGAIGFRVAGDFEQGSVGTTRGRPRGCIRTFLSEDGTVVAAAYHVRTPWIFSQWLVFGRGGQNVRAVEFETEFSNETFLNTTRARSAAQHPPCTGYVEVSVPPGSTTPVMLERHRAAVQSYCREHDVVPRSISTVDELLASQARQHNLVSEHLRDTDYLGEETREAYLEGRLTRNQEAYVDAIIERLRRDAKRHTS